MNTIPIGGHQHTLQIGVGLRYRQVLGERETLQQPFCCLTCGYIEWRDVPLVVADSHKEKI